MSSLRHPPSVVRMTSSKHPWYWARRGWRVSAALVDDGLVMVSRTWSVGPQSLRDEMARSGRRQCPS